MPPKKVNIIELMSLRRNHDQLAVHDEDANPIRPQPPKRRFRGSLGNWKGTLYLGSLTCFIVLCVNVSVVSWAATGDSSFSEAVLYTGDCDKVKRMSTGIHLLINVLSTLLLAASNFSMQCLCAPTREDLDYAHKRNYWLDIGVPSIRNLQSISRVKRLLWICLVLSSLPLHLFYNSTVFSTLAGNSYEVYVGNSTFTSLKSAQDLTISNANSHDLLDSIPDPFSRLVQESANDNLKKLMPDKCISAYASYYQTDHGSLMLITEDLNTTNSDFVQLYVERVMDTLEDLPTAPYSWMCDKFAEILYGTNWECTSKMAEMQSSPDDWVVDGYKVSYCLAEELTQTCTLEFSFPLAIVVVVANFFKVVVICATAFHLKCAPLLTAGDAVVSFLKRPDEATKGKCLLSRESVTEPEYNKDHEFRYKDEHKMWSSSLSVRRWAVCILSYVCPFNNLPLSWLILTGVIRYLFSIGICLLLLLYGYTQRNSNSIQGNWFIGLAVIEPITFIRGRWPKSLISNTIIANIPQLIFSVLYFMANSVWTSMTLAAEWNSYSIHRKSLRVSTFLRGHQRSTYFLSLPYRYALPLISFSGVLHWLISQSLYVVIIRGHGVNHKRDPRLDSVTCAYSPVGIVSSVSVGAFMLVCLVVMGCRRFKSGMPVAGSCSLAIAAACHSSYVQKDDDDNDEDDDSEKLGAEYQPLKWGVEILIPGEIEAEIGHCTFSSGEVEMPRNGTIYL